MELLIRNARVGDGIVDIAIEDGRFARIGADLDADAPQTVDADGCSQHLRSSIATSIWTRR